MSAPWTTPCDGSAPTSGIRAGDYLSDAFTLLAGWTHDESEIIRTLPLDDAQHAALTERIKVVADALRLRPEIRRREGETQIRLGTPGGVALTQGTVTMAARIEDAYRTITGAA
jgi:4a-hydroxytetrahydrobiopterin dehydratase